jgi:capsular polysaccharide biosynthesis protein
VWESLRRHWLIALLPVVLLVGAAVAYGLQRSPEYTSEARLNVGGLNLTQQSIEGYTHAVAQLAVAYSRSIDATGVTEPVAKDLGVTQDEVVDAVSATPIQGSPVISIHATADDASEAERLADSAADSLVDYAVTLNSGRELSDDLLERFVDASADFRKARLALDRAPARGRRREQLETRVDTAKLRMDTVRFLYGQSQAGQATVHIVQKLAPAAVAKSDRRDKLEDYVAAALIAGLLIGVGLAVARANAVTRRRLGER